MSCNGIYNVHAHKNQISHEITWSIVPFWLIYVLGAGGKGVRMLKLCSSRLLGGGEGLDLPPLPRANFSSSNGEG